jgi:CBS domain containing-hemolysin-like protein
VVLAAVLVVAALILVNAVYVAAEFAAVSARRSRIKQLAEEGSPLASWLVPILERPESLDRYIAACQIGITVSGLVLGAYAQATIAGGLTPWVAAAGLQESTAQSVSIGIVLLLLTVAQVIFAELVPRSLALQYPSEDAQAHSFAGRDRAADRGKPRWRSSGTRRASPPSTCAPPEHAAGEAADGPAAGNLGD